MSEPSREADAPRWAAALAWVVSLSAVLWVFAPVLSPGSALYYRDHDKVFRRLFELTGAAYRGGRLPLWDPLLGGGEPLAAYPAGMAFSPLQLITSFVPAALDPYDLFVVACYLVGFGGAYALGRTIGLDARGRLTAAVCFTLSGVILSFNSLIPALHSAVFGPWAIALALEVWRSPSRSRVGALALALALHAHATDPALLVCDALVFAGLLPRISRGDAPLGRRLGALAGGAALALGISAIQLLPLFELLAGTVRGAGHARNDFWNAHPIFVALGSSLPGLGGDLLHQTALFSTAPSGDHYLSSLYFSAVALPCVLASMVARGTRAASVALALSVLLAFGASAPLLELAQAIIPGLTSSRFPVKFMYGAALLVPLLVPLALERALSAPRPALLVAGAWLAAIALTGALDGPWWLARVPSHGLDADGVGALFEGARAHALTVAGLAAVLLVLARRARAWAWAFPALLALDLAAAGREVVITMPALPSDPPDAARLLLADAAEPTVFRYESPVAASDLEQLAIHGYEVLEPRSATHFGVRYLLDHDLNGIRPLGWRRVQEHVQGLRSEREKLALLGRLGATHLMVSTRRRELPGLERVGTATLSFGAPISVFRISGARPRLSFATRARRAPDLDAAILAMSSTVAARDEVVVLEPVELPSPGPSPSPARLSERDGVIELSTELPGVVVIAQRYERGWRAELDGAEARIFPVDVLLTGVPVPAGSHRLTLRYAPGSVSTGALVSALSLVLALLILAWPRRALRA